MIAAARDAVKLGDADLLRAIYSNPSQILSDLIRTALVAAPGHQFFIGDESSIEARVLAWIANEKWRLDVFLGHGRIYEASAAQMFKVPIERIVKGNPEYALRAKGKVAELALGFGGGFGALTKMGALTMGLSEDDLPLLVGKWRGANQQIVALWSQVENDAKRVIRERIAVKRDKYGFSTDAKSLLMHLPSGRTVAYWNARIQDSQITFDGQDATTKKWGAIKTYGGKLVENLVQAIARDCMAEAMLRMNANGYPIRMTVHDEIITEVPLGFGSTEEVEQLMSAPIDWAPGLPLKAVVFASPWYCK